MLGQLNNSNQAKNSGLTDGAEEWLDENGNPTYAFLSL